MSILCLTADTISSGNWLIVLCLNVKNCYANNVFASKLGLGSVSDFPNTTARGSTTVESTLEGPSSLDVQFYGLFFLS